MIKLALAFVLVGFTVAQLAGLGGKNMMRMMMMQQMMGGNDAAGSSSASGTSAATPPSPLGTLGLSGGARGATGGMMGGLMGMMNNPALLCRNTENLTMLPCRRWRGICDIMSMQTYGFPGLMKCSPIGFGCCIKDIMSYTLIQNL